MAIRPDQTVRDTRTPMRDIFGYAIGDGAYSLVLNTVGGYAMVFYTEAMGLHYKWAAAAIAVTTLWDAITDPLMGHITDNTHTRYGRRHPYILFGGLLMVLSFYFLWDVPAIFQSTMTMLFGYLLVVNLMMRTAATVFAVPYGALGFEVCTDYDQRSTLQGIRSFWNMVVNFAGPAMAWSLFFPDTGDQTSTKETANYIRMGGAFSIAAAIFILLVVFATRKYMQDTRHLRPTAGRGSKGFFIDMLDIIKDKTPRTVFAFCFCVIWGIALVASLQMYVYIHFMKFTGIEKTIVHGGTMTGMGLFSLLSPVVARKLDKKPTVFIGVAMHITTNILLAVIFLPGWFQTQTLFHIGSFAVRSGTLIFFVLQLIYWGGSGMMFPIFNSMVADISEINKYRTGVLKDGAYSAVLSFLFKASQSIGLLVSGWCLAWAGFQVGAETQSPQAVWNLAAMMFLISSLISLASMFIMLKYPVSRKYMQQIKAELKTTES